MAYHVFLATAIPRLDVVTNMSLDVKLLKELFDITIETKPLYKRSLALQASGELSGGMHCQR